MISFKSDYSEGAHQKILDALIRSNFYQTDGYGDDPYTERAANLIKKKLKNENVDVHFLVGGTQTNLTVISSALRSYEAVISVESGHILVHETGAIEATGHKIISCAGENGKLRVCDVEKALKQHVDLHMVKPKMVYISNSTEIGTIYTKKELQELNEVCKKNNLYLFMDGARLGSALMSSENDVDLCEMANLVDVFYLGGTKNGALFGEALVICNDNLKEEFKFNMKQRGALLAKGRILGIQFEELFKEDLFFNLADHANRMADILRDGIKQAGYDFMIDSKTNQLFPIMPNSLLEKISKKYSYTFWEEFEENTSVIRLVTSWATKEEDILGFIDDLK